jgi:hypothetical protein
MKKRKFKPGEVELRRNAPSAVRFYLGLNAREADNISDWNFALGCDGRIVSFVLPYIDMCSVPIFLSKECIGNDT